MTGITGKVVLNGIIVYKSPSRVSGTINGAAVTGQAHAEITPTYTLPISI